VSGCLYHLNQLPFVRDLQWCSYVTPQKYFWDPSLVIYFFPTPPIKLKLGLQISGRLLIATDLDQSNYLANQQQVLVFAVPFTSLSKLGKNAKPKPFCWTKPVCFDFSSSNFRLLGHIPSTSGVALSITLQLVAPILGAQEAWTQQPTHHELRS
jgi:hypothetical protein